MRWKHVQLICCRLILVVDGNKWMKKWRGNRASGGGGVKLIWLIAILLFLIGGSNIHLWSQRLDLGDEELRRSEDGMRWDGGEEEIGAKIRISAFLQQESAASSGYARRIAKQRHTQKNKFMKSGRSKDVFLEPKHPTTHKTHNFIPLKGLRRMKTCRRLFVISAWKCSERVVQWLTIRLHSNRLICILKVINGWSKKLVKWSSKFVGRRKKLSTRTKCKQILIKKATLKVCLPNEDEN